MLYLYPELLGTAVFHLGNHCSGFWLDAIMWKGHFSLTTAVSMWSTKLQFKSLILKKKEEEEAKHILFCSYKKLSAVSIMNCPIHSACFDGICFALEESWAIHSDGRGRLITQV